MARADRPIIIAGGGLAGGLTALALRRLRPDQALLLIEAETRFGGDHVWSCFDADVAKEHRWLVDPLTERRWDGYDIAFPRRKRTLGTGYSSLRSSLLDAQLRQCLRPQEYRLGARAAAVDGKAVRLADGERIEGVAVIDARGAGGLAGLDLAWQKFLGIEYRLAAPHGLKRPIVMDACVDQQEGYRFVYTLPFAADRLLVEDTYYSESPALDEDALERRIAAYARARGWKAAERLHAERGVLPVALGGDFDRFWPAGDGSARIGMRGGFFHPTTGYSLPDAVRTAVEIATAPALEALPDRLRALSRRLWGERGFYRLLNRMLFRAADPADRYRVLEHFYRIDARAIERFYAARSTRLDRLRILSGRPPVPVGKALRALWA